MRSETTAWRTGVRVLRAATADSCDSGGSRPIQAVTGPSPIAPTDTGVKLPRTRRIKRGTVLAITIAASTVFAQTPAARSQVSGTITSVNGSQLTMAGDKGDTVEVATTERTLVLRIP